MQITELNLEELKGRAENFRLNSIAESTRKSRAGQWGIYLNICNKFGWSPLPCSIEQACLYVTHLSFKLKFSTIKTYYQAVIFYHVCAGLCPVRLSNPVLAATMKGIERANGSSENAKDPILPNHLLCILRASNLHCELEFVVWVATLLMFRTLLRVSNVVVSDHTLRASDVTFTKEGCFVRVQSSKTTTTRDKATVLPVVYSANSRICAARWLLMLFKRFKPSPDAYLFSSPTVPKLTYSMFSKKFKEMTTKAELQGDFASHSLRRGGATFMSMLERPVDQIKSRGLWKSDCVYRYIVPPMSAKIRNEKQVAIHC